MVASGKYLTRNRQGFEVPFTAFPLYLAYKGLREGTDLISDASEEGRVHNTIDDIERLKDHLY